MLVICHLQRKALLTLRLNALVTDMAGVVHWMLWIVLIMWHRHICCCGLSLPRNTNWQREIPVYKNIDGKSDEEKTKAIQTTHIGSPLYFQGHTMMYLGTYNGRIYVISALGSLYDAGNDEKRNVYSVAINTLDAKRANGKTWLANITGYNQFEFTDE